MPEAFNRAYKAGAKIRTKKLGGGKYMHIAITKAGKTIAGEIKKRRGNAEDD